MSIYATWLSLDGFHEETCSIWVPDGGDDIVRMGDGPCSCGLPLQPLVYEGSHVLPSDTDRKGGGVDVAAIPDFITRDGRDDAPEGALKDWLRLSVDSEDSTTQYEGKPYEQAGNATVVLTRRQVEELRDTLTAWLDREETA